MAGGRVRWTSSWFLRPAWRADPGSVPCAVLSRAHLVGAQVGPEELEGQKSSPERCAQWSKQAFGGWEGCTAI